MTKQFPTKQDVRTHNSVAAKIEKHNSLDSSDRLAIRDPDTLCDAVLEQAKTLYRKGDSLFEVRVRVRTDNFLEWARRDQGVSRLEDVNPLLILPRVHSATIRSLKTERLSHGTFVVTSSFKTPVFGIVEFHVMISVIRPRPTE